MITRPDASPSLVELAVGSRVDEVVAARGIRHGDAGAEVRLLVAGTRVDVAALEVTFGCPLADGLVEGLAVMSATADSEQHRTHDTHHTKVMHACNLPFGTHRIASERPGRTRRGSSTWIGERAPPTS